MKNIAVILGTSVFSLFIIHSTSMAQCKVKYDQSYSTSNYKQPHKAKIARELNLGNPVTTQYEFDAKSNNVLDNQNNYKAATTKERTPDGAVLGSKIVSKNTNCLESEDNYKTRSGRKR
jgi:hypothetical protein